MDGGITCTHIPSDALKSLDEKTAAKPTQCDAQGCDERKGLWMCATPGCAFVGCGRTQGQHFIRHRSENPSHCVCVSADSGQIWCYECDDEVSPPVVEITRTVPPRGAASTSSATAMSVDEEDGEGMGILPVSSIGGRVGLANLGNTCYMDAAVQVLAQCEPLQALMLGRFRHAHAAKDGSLTRQLAGVLRALWTGSEKYIAPRAFLSTLKTLNPVFRGYAQQDSEELLRFTLSRMDEELKYRTADGSTSSFVQKAFGGEYVSMVTCDVCKTVSRKTEPFTVLSLEIPDASSLRRISIAQDKAAEEQAAQNGGQGKANGGSSSNGGSNGSSNGGSNGSSGSSGSNGSSGGISGWFSSILSFFTSEGSWVSEMLPARAASLADCFAHFCEDEKLSGENSYQCDTCKRLQTAERSIRLSKLPEIFSIQLKRFKHNGYFSNKISTHVSFPLTDFDVSEFSSAPVDNSLYELIGVVNHSGGMGGGHYTSYAKHMLDGTWSLYNDSYVSRAHADDVAESEAYILVYRRVAADTADKEADVTAAIRGVTAPDARNCPAYVSKQWLTLLETTVDPGPIDNCTFACEHGGLRAECADAAGACVALPLEIYQRLHAKYGGGPLVTEFVECEECKKIGAALQERRDRESKMINEMHEATIDSDEPLYYYLSTFWLNKWEAFIKAKNRYHVAPGPVDNSPLLTKEKTPKATIKLDKDYVPIREAVWREFVRIYGGGPALTHPHLQYRPPRDDDSPAALKEELQTIVDLVNAQGPIRLPWFIISMTWVRAWRNYCLGKGPHPGPIDNKPLLNEDGLRDDLVFDKTYLSFQRPVWDKLHARYGGGPRVTCMFERVEDDASRKDDATKAAREDGKMTPPGAPSSPAPHASNGKRKSNQRQ